MINQPEKFIDVDSLKKTWVQNGKYYGYPDCCISDFISRGFDMELTKEQNEIHQFTGFIPCQKCCLKIKTGDTTLTGLIVNRLCESNFPKAS